MPRRVGFLAVLHTGATSEARRRCAWRPGHTVTFAEHSGETTLSVNARVVTSTAKAGAVSRGDWGGLGTTPGPPQDVPQGGV